MDQQDHRQSIAFKLAWIGIATHLCYAAVYFHYDIVKKASIYNLALALLFSIPLLVLRKHSFYGKILLALVYFFNMFMVAAVLFPRSTGFYLFFIIGAPIGFILFSRQERIWRYLVAMLALGLLVYIPISNGPDPIIPLPAHLIKVMYFTSIITTGLVITLFVIFFSVEIDKKENFLRELAIRDPLTMLYNRRYFDEILHNMDSLQDRYQGDFSILFLDIDNFKTINDSYGHPSGDIILKKLAALLQSMMRLSDTVCRYGGEEFVILLPRTCLELAGKVAERLRERVQKHHMGEHLPAITISIGVSHSSEREDSLQVIALADQRLLRAKQEGRNRVVKNTPAVTKKDINVFVSG